MYHVIRPHERSAGKVLTLLLLFHLRVKRFNATNVDRLGNIPSIVVTVPFVCTAVMVKGPLVGTLSLG